MPNPLIKVNTFIVRHGDLVNTIQLLFTDGVRSVFSPTFGTNYNAAYAEWVVPEDEFITQVEYTVYAGYLRGFNLITDKGHKSPRFGPIDGEYSLITFPEGYTIMGLYGASGLIVDRLGFILGKTIYPKDPEYEETDSKIVKIEDVENNKEIEVKVKMLRIDLE